MKLPTLKYPVTKKVEQIDNYHDVTISDSYQWLEDTTSSKVQEWIKQQNELTRAFLNQLPRESIETELRELYDYSNIRTLKVIMTNSGPRFFFTLRGDKSTQAILYYQDGELGERKELVNPLKISPDGLITIDWFFPSPNGELVAYGLSKDGSELSTLYVINIESGINLPNEEIPRSRMCSLAWFDDSKRFYYTRNPLIGEVPPEDENYYRHVYYHTIGTDYHQDIKIFGEGRAKTDIPELKISPNGKFLVIRLFRFTMTDVFVTRIPIDDPTNLAFTTIFEGQEGKNEPILINNDLFLFTQVNYPNGAVIRYQLEDLLVNSSTLLDNEIIIPESDSTIIEINYYAEGIVVFKNKDIRSSIWIYNINGELLKKIDFDEPVNLLEIEAGANFSQFFFKKNSFSSTPAYYSFNIKQGLNQVLKEDDSISVDYLDVEQVWYNSKDGTSVPMFLLKQKGAQPSSQTPVILYGYGGFNISLTPIYNPLALLWIKKGGLFAIPNIRGGGELGNEWHKGGYRENKQNVFDDFIAAAEWLISHDYGSRSTLAICGGSNGGLLVGAMLIQRPDLVRAVYCAVPLLDMVRYTRFLIAKFWTTEYGDPDKSDELEWLYRYSPYHHISKDKNYPASFFYTAESDSRVDPMHAMKMAAKMQGINSTFAYDKPFLLWVETKAGHGIGMPVDKVVGIKTDEFLFCGHFTGLKLS